MPLWGDYAGGGRSNNRPIRTSSASTREGVGEMLGEGGRVGHRTLCAPSDPGDVASWLGALAAIRTERVFL